MIIGASADKIEKLAQKKKTDKIIPYTKSKDKNIRLAAIQALGISGGDEGFNRLTQLLSSADADERAAASAALGTLGRPQARSFLSYYIEREKDVRVQESMKNAMAKLQASN